MESKIAMSNSDQAETQPFYLRDVWLENAGPIEKLDLSLPFNTDGTPKPIVIVGSNGTGKTILLSYIADALIEMAKTAFEDIVTPNRNGGKPYLRVVGGANQNPNTVFNLGTLHFSNEVRHVISVEKSGVLDCSSYQQKLARFQGSINWPTGGNYKASSGGDEAFYRDYFVSNSTCYFPSNRSERPHWINQDSISEENRFYFDPRISNILGRSIIAEQTSPQNKQWLLDVILDSRVDVSVNFNSDNSANYSFEPNLAFLLSCKQSLTNVNNLLNKVLQEKSSSLLIGHRSSGSRLIIQKNEQIFLPSLEHLSAGQAILFNLFAAIIRYSDRNAAYKSVTLDQIEGIVIVDEIDAHLHADLQHEVLPTLMKLFPRVQFIVTTHSPLFLLGMEKTYGEEGFVILDMPSGQRITTERFAEFQKSYDYYKDTKTYESDLEQKLAQSSKPLVLTEGETDPKYIKTALELLGHFDLLNALDIEWIGAQTPGKKGQSFNTGDTALNHASEMIRANPELTTRKVLLLYDCDTQKPSLNEGRLSVRKIPQNNTNTKVKKGVENLLPVSVFENQFYSEHRKDKDDGGFNISRELDKMNLCNFVCTNRRITDFSGFSVVIEILREFFEM